METEILDEIKVGPNIIGESGNLSPILEYDCNDTGNKLEDIKVLLEQNYFNAKCRIISTFNAIKDSFLQDLNNILNQKLFVLEKMNAKFEEKKVETDGTDEELISEQNFKSFQILDFIVETDVDLKHTLGYIRCATAQPDSFKIIIMTPLYQVGTDFDILAKGTEEWYPLLLSSLNGWMMDTDENRIDARIDDERNGSYILHFGLNHYGKYLICVTLYEKNVSNSPILIQIGNAGPNQSHKRLRNTSEEDVTKPEDLDFSGESITVSNLDRNDRKKSNYTKDRNSGIKGKLITTLSRENGINLRYPIGLAVNKYHDIVICDAGNDIVWLVDQLGIPKTVIKPNVKANLYKPSAAVFLKDGSFVVKDNYCLYHFDSNGLLIRKFEREALRRPYGLVSIHNERLLTLNETEDPSLVIFNRDGRMECLHRYQPLENRPQTSKCRFMASYLDQLVVSDLGLSKIYKTTVDGKTVTTFGSYGRIEGEMIEPSGISFYAADTAHPIMLIADSKNDRIQYFDSYCQYLGTVQLSHPIRRPSDIVVTNDGWLYVLNYLDHFMGMYELEIKETIISTFDANR